jgi:hypothetical protein
MLCVVEGVALLGVVPMHGISVFKPIFVADRTYTTPLVAQNELEGGQRRG